MIRSLAALMLVAAALLVGGCPQPTVLTTVTLVNNSENDVSVRVAFAAEPNISEDSPRDDGSELQFELAAGQTTSFTRSCGEIGAVFIEEARLQVVGQIGPTTESVVQRQEQNYSCGQEIVFTFDHSDIILDFDVDVTVRNVP